MAFLKHAADVPLPHFSGYCGEHELDYPGSKQLWYTVSSPRGMTISISSSRILDTRSALASLALDDERSSLQIHQEAEEFNDEIPKIDRQSRALTKIRKRCRSPSIYGSD